MRRPKPGTIRRKTAYWDDIERNRPFPPWAFDFVGVHHQDLTGGYALSAPILLVDPKTSRRPAWEREQYTTKGEAIKRARNIARRHGIHVLDCN